MNGRLGLWPGNGKGHAMAAGGLFIGPMDAPDRYELKVVLDGSGFEGKVWGGWATFADSPLAVAVKIYHAGRVEGRPLAQTRDHLLELTARMRSLHHPGLATVHDPFIGAPPHPFGEPDPDATPVLVLPMAFIEGKGFNEWCQGETSFGARLRMLANAGDALDEMHAHQLVHADIKPSNIMITKTSPQRSVLVDYGLVRYVGGSANRRTVGGTPGYWAPEAKEFARYSPSSDIFAFACTIVFALTGMQPPENGDRRQWAQNCLAGSELTLDAIAALVRAVSSDPSDRDQTATASSLLAHVRQSRTTLPAVIDAMAPPPVPAPAPKSSPPPPVPRRNNRRAGRTAIAVLAVAAVSVGSFLWFAEADGNDDVSSANVTDPAQTAESQLAAGEVDVPTTTDRPPTTTTSLPTVPNLVGKDFATAQAELAAVGFEAVLDEREGPLPHGVVIESSPSSGTPADPELVGVTVVIHRAPAELPTFVGLDEQDAVALAKDFGIVVDVLEVLATDGSTRDSVTAQEPAAGSPFAPAVSLTLTRRPAVRYLNELELIVWDGVGYPSVNAPFDHDYDATVGVGGQNYSRSLSTNPKGTETAFYEFHLGGNYEWFNAFVGIDPLAYTGSVLRFEVYADGQLIDGGGVELGLGGSHEFTLPVSGVNRLQVRTTQVGYGDGPDKTDVDGYWGAAQVLGFPSMVPPPGG